MNYYKIIGATDFECVNFLDTSYYDKLAWLESRETVDFGTESQIKLVKPDRRQKAKKSDFPCYGTNFIFMRDYVYYKDKDFFEPFGVFFPIYSTKGDKLYIFNCDVLENALDEEKSDFTRFSSGKVMMINKYVFNNDIPEDKYIFRVPYEGYPIIVNDKFLEYYNSNNYKGMTFKKVS